MITGESEVRELLSQSLTADWAIFLTGTLHQAIDVIVREKIVVVACDREAPGFDWRKAMLALSSPPCNACVILLSRFAGRSFWEEVAELGGYEVLPMPLPPDTLFQVVKAAWFHWQSQQAFLKMGSKSIQAGRKLG